MFLAKYEWWKNNSGMCVTRRTQYHHKPLDLQYVCCLLTKLQFSSVEVVVMHGLVMPFISGSRLCRCLLLVSLQLCASEQSVGSSKPHFS